MTGRCEGKGSFTFHELSEGLESSERVGEGVILTDKIGLCTCDNMRLWFNRTETRTYLSSALLTSLLDDEMAPQLIRWTP